MNEGCMMDEYQYWMNDGWIKSILDNNRWMKCMMDEDQYWMNENGMMG